MKKEWILRFNIALVAISLFIFFQAGVIFFKRSADIPIPKPSTKIEPIPKHAYAQSPTAYDQIGAPLIKLDKIKPDITLPDLQKILTFNGYNQRPDAPNPSPLLFSLTKSEDAVATPPNEKLYLQYKQFGSTGFYIFSPKNKETSLWLTARTRNKQAEVNLFIKNDAGKIIQRPRNRARFTLPPTFQTEKVDRLHLGNQSIYQNVLKVQAVIWHGQDLFLATHGGKDYDRLRGKEKLTFIYSPVDYDSSPDIETLFLKLGDTLIWSGDRWIPAKPSEKTRGNPMLVLRSLTDESLVFQLWDVDGKTSIPVTLRKPKTNKLTNLIEKDFQYLGSRTNSRLIFNVKGNRILVSPRDWLIQTPENGWKKLNTTREVQDVIGGKIKGELFIVNDIKREGSTYTLEGLLYNKSRNDVVDVNLVLQRNKSQYKGSHFSSGQNRPRY